MKKFRLGDIANVVISGIDKKTKEGESAIRLCNFTDVYYNWAITNNMYNDLMLASASDSDIETFSLKKGQVAITKDSETRDDIGVATYIADDFDDVVLGYHCALITPRTDVPEEEKIYGKYLNALLHTKYAQKYFSNNATGSGQRYTLSKEAIEDMPVYLPSYKEQVRIGDYLSDIDKKIEIINLINAELEAMSKQIYDYWFVQFDFPNEEGKPYKSSGGKMVWNSTLKQEIPEGWGNESIDKLCLINNESIGRDYNINTIKYLDTSNIIENRIISFQYYKKAEAPSRAQRRVKDKTILYSTVRPSLNHSGILHNPKPHLIVSTGFATIDVVNPYDCYRLYEFMVSKSINAYLTKLADTSVSAYPSISPSDIGALSVTVPNPAIIREFHNIVEPLFIAIDKNLKEIRTLLSLREYQLPLLMNGQLTIKN